MDRDTLDRWCEQGILGMVLAILVFGPLAFGAVDLPAIVGIQALVCGVLLLWMVRIWLSRSYRVLWAPICWAVAAFLLYAIARYRMVLEEHGIEYLAREEVLLVFTYGALFFAILNNLSRQESTQIISMTLIAVGTLLSLYALYQFVTKSRYVLWAPQFLSYRGRGSATYICPNHLAGLLEMILPLGLGYTLTGRFRPTTKVFLGYASCALFVGIGVSVSRGAWVATGCSLLVFFGLLLRQRGRRLAGILFIVLLLGGFVFFVKNLAVLQHRVGASNTEAKIDIVRLELWRPAVQMWRDHFWWGMGPSQFDDRFRAYRPDDIQMRPSYTHNDYLNTLVDWGLVGMLLIGGSIVVLFYGVIQSWKFVQRSNDIAAKRSNRSAFVLGCAAGLLAILIHSLVDFNMHIPANAIVAVTLMAMLTGHLRFATERHWLKLGWIGKLLLTGVCLTWAGFLGKQVVRQGSEAWLLRRASRVTDFQRKVDFLKAAHAVEPNNPETTYDLGETLRLASWEGVGAYRQLASEAIQWFDLGIKLNPFDPFNYVRLGMCLHWLGRSSEAGPYFTKAIELDPRNYVIQGLLGWHYFQLSDWDASERWYKQAIFQAHWHPEKELKNYDDGHFYLELIKQKRQETNSVPDPASGQSPHAK